MKKLVMLFVLLGFVLSGCMYIEMDVKNVPSSGKDVSKLHTFSDKKGSENSEIGKALFEAVKDDLEKKGFKYVDKNPDFMVLVNYKTTPYAERGTTYSRDNMNYDYIEKNFTDIGVTKTSDETLFNNVVKVYLTSTDEINPVYYWKGMAESTNREGLLRFGDCLVKGALINFPEGGTGPHKFNIKECAK